MGLLSISAAMTETTEAAATDVLHQLRAAEMETALAWFPRRARVLELGGADGFQARIMRDRGYDVASIDIAGRPAPERAFFDVQLYDGVHIPFPDQAFDVVFSSNVLEHISGLPAMLREIRRVLRTDGLTIHLVPSASWRVWTTVVHYPWQARRLLWRGDPRRGAAGTGAGASAASVGAAERVKRALGLAAHGEYPNALSEVHYFRRARWERFLADHGLELLHAGGNELFYTGYGMFPQTSVPTRRRLSRVLGASCHLFVARFK